MQNVAFDDTDQPDIVLGKTEDDLTKNDIITNEIQTNRTMIKNMIVLSCAFLLLFTSFLSLQNLQSSLNQEENLGLMSLIIIYSSLILSCMFIPPAMIGQLGCKWTLVISMTCFSAFTAANYYPRWYTLGFASVLLGKLNTINLLITPIITQTVEVVCHNTPAYLSHLPPTTYTDYSYSILTTLILPLAYS